MASSRAVQSYVFWAGFTITVWVIFVGGALAFAVLDPAQDLNHVAITITAVYFVGAWVGASAVMLIARPDEWRRVSLRVRYARLMWTLALTAHLAHVLFAFWLAHGWSHDEAVRHVEEVCGFAEGILVNYLFAAVWLADAVWWWANPTGYANRPRWVGWAVHGFLAFVMFNAAVVFASPDMRMSNAMLFAILAGLLLWRAGGRQPAAHG
ncbi:MAG TPA: hypothetical protein VKE74_18790 [Gemmataceae bacterium]|nr:hypothetical protein [Gemmataceae bacterium]